MSAAKTGVYWPFKTFLQGSGITILEDADTVKISTTGAGPGGGDMLISVFATNGVSGKVDHAVTADSVSGSVAHATLADGVPWNGITGAPTIFPADWANISNKPSLFPTNWSLISGLPVSFPPAQHGSSHLSTGSDPMPLATVGASGALISLSGNADDFLNGLGNFADVAATVAQTALLRAGDTLASGATLKGNVDVPLSSVGYSLAPFIAESQSSAGFGAIGLHSQGFWGCALGATQNGLTIATSTGAAVQLTNTNGLIIASALAAGVALANLGYTPINSAGGSYTLPAPLVLVKDYGLAASSYVNAALRVQNVTSGGRPQIAFLIQGVVGASLYLETDSTMRIINSGGAVARLHDTLHLLAGTDLAAGAAQANLGFPPINKNGDTMTGVQHVFQRDLALSGSSYAQAPLLVASASTNVNYRAGIGFENRNRVGVFLFVDNDNKFKFIDGGGVVHVISST